MQYEFSTDGAICFPAWLVAKVAFICLQNQKVGWYCFASNNSFELLVAKLFFKKYKNIKAQRNLLTPDVESVLTPTRHLIGQCSDALPLWEGVRKGVSSAWQPMRVGWMNMDTQDQVQQGFEPGLRGAWKWSIWDTSVHKRYSFRSGSAADKLWCSCAKVYPSHLTR